MMVSGNEQQAGEASRPKPLRLWPGVAGAVLLLVVKFIFPVVMTDALPVVVLGGLLCGLLVIVWWGFFSRAPGLDRLGAVVLIVLGLVAVRPFLHASIANAGMGMLFPILAIPVLSLTLVGWAVISRRFSLRLRRVTLVATVLLTVAFWTLIRTGGLDHEGDSDFAWRWTKTSEERLLARTGDEPIAVPPPAALEGTEPEWPGFRGPNRDGVIRGVTLETDWSVSPPVKLWRRPVGPGWSSFAVHGDRFYTQEQRGRDEIVSCYAVTTGKPIWRHRDAARFWESNAGPGPRGTPTLHGHRVFAFGATGIVNALEARDGRVEWSRNAATDTGTEVPYWGFASSPLVVEDRVIVAAAGSLIAYDRATGEVRWSRPARGDCYSSPHLLTIGGVAQVLLQNRAGAISVAPGDGALLWEHAWKGMPIVQPARAANGDILLSVDDRSGIRRIAVARGPGGWAVEERWTSARVKPYFNDSAVHRGHVYGFTGRALACLDAENGARKWKGGRYGRGQLVLLADQDLLLVLSDRGELALVKAVPDRFTELARFSAIEGKTWNHPVLVGDVLLVRNAEEMAAFRLTVAGRD
jgi:outer membrane protein assembly factor BamB